MPATPADTGTEPPRSPGGRGPTSEPPAPEPVVAEPPEEEHRHRRPLRSPKAPRRRRAKVPAPSPTGAVCEECGAAVSAAEEKTSRLFVSRTLCKKCIQTL